MGIWIKKNCSVIRIYSMAVVLVRVEQFTGMLQRGSVTDRRLQNVKCNRLMLISLSKSQFTSDIKPLDSQLNGKTPSLLPLCLRCRWSETLLPLFPLVASTSPPRPLQLPLRGRSRRVGQRPLLPPSPWRRPPLRLGPPWSERSIKTKERLFKSWLEARQGSESCGGAGHLPDFGTSAS